MTPTISFIGDPVTALIIGVLISLHLVKKEDMGTAVDKWMSAGIKDAAIILAITGAGGSFGRVLQGSPIVEFIKTNMAGLEMGIFLPFIISAALKTAQGSSTVAIITTATILASLNTAYKAYTSATAVEGITAMIAVVILSLFV